MSFSRTTVGALAAGILLGTCAMASADHVRGHHGKRHHARKVVRVVPPPPAVDPVLGDDAYLYGPRYRNGADVDLTTDGSAIGREGDLVQRDGSPKGYRGPGLELEGPPLYSSLPVVPELYDPSLR